MFYNSQGMIEVQQPPKEMPHSSSPHAELKLTLRDSQGNQMQPEVLVSHVEAEKVSDSVAAEASSPVPVDTPRAAKEINGGYENLSGLVNLFKEPKTREDRIQKNPGQARRRALKRQKQLEQQGDAPIDQQEQTQPQPQSIQTPPQPQPQPQPQQQPSPQPQAQKSVKQDEPKQAKPQQKQAKARSPKQQEPQPQLAHELQATVSVSSVAALLKEILLENAKEIAAIQQAQQTRTPGRSDQPDWRRQHQPLQNKQRQARQPRQNNKNERQEAQQQTSRRPPTINQPSHLKQLIEKHLSPSIEKQDKVKAAPALM